MQIDWFTIAAQIVNFLILVGLLAKFFYKPVLKAMDEREKRVTSRLEKAKKQEEEAKQARKDYEEKSKQLDDDKEKILKKAHEEAEDERKKQFKDIKEDVEAKRKEWLKALQNDQLQMQQSIRENAQKALFSCMERTLSELADTTLDERVAERFIAYIKNMPGEKRNEIISSLNGGKLTIASAYALNKDMQSRLEEILGSLTPESATIDFVIKPELISGIELTVDGARLGWSIEEHLRSMYEELDYLVKEEVNG